MNLMTEPAAAGAGDKGDIDAVERFLRHGEVMEKGSGRVRRDSIGAVE